MVAAHDKAERFAAACVTAFRQRGLSPTLAAIEIYEHQQVGVDWCWDDVHDILASRWLITFGDAV